MANPIGRGKSWTPERNQKLIELWDKHNIETLSRMLGRSEAGLFQQANKLGLPRKPKRNATPHEIIEFVRNNAKQMTGAEIAKKFGYTTQGIHSIAERYGISFS